MCPKSYSPDSECNVSVDVFEKKIPLQHNTIFYVENPDNEKQNCLVQLYFLLNPNAFIPHDLRPLRYRYCYLTQRELQPENLYKHLAKSGVDYNDRTALETIDFLRECLHANTGGYLVARQLPKISPKNDTLAIDSEEHLVSFPLFNPADTEQCIRDFVLRVAYGDFERLSGVSYYSYQRDKYEKSEHQSIPPGTFSCIVCRNDIPEIDDTFRQAIIFLQERGILRLSPGENIDNTPDLMEKLSELMKNDKKIDKLCELKVDKKGNIFYDLDGKLNKINFKRYALQRTLYILFLRQLERAINDPTGNTPKHICPYYFDTFIDQRLNSGYDYKNELLAIYRKIKSSPLADLKETIDNYGKKEAGNDISSLNKVFEKIFNTDFIEKENKGKHYTINEVGRDSKTGQILYSIDLDKTDFDLGDFSIDKLKV